jgi:hypothetical protein
MNALTPKKEVKTMENEATQMMPKDRLTSSQVYEQLRWMRPNLPISLHSEYTTDPSMRGMPQIILNDVQFFTPRHAMMLADTPFDAHSEQRYPEYGFTRQSLNEYLNNKSLSCWAATVTKEGSRLRNVRCTSCGSFHWDYHDYCVVCGNGGWNGEMYDWCETVSGSPSCVDDLPTVDSIDLLAGGVVE